MTKPTDRAQQAMRRIDLAHATLKRAWDHQPDGELSTGRPTTGRITSSRIPDPASDTAARQERVRTDVLAEVTEATAELAGIDAIDVDPAPIFRCRRLQDVLALHRQYAGQLLTRIRQLETPTGWDDAKSLTGTLAAHAQQIHRIANNAYSRLTTPDAEPGTTVCADDWCQRVAHENSIWCRQHRDREERKAAKAEQRRRQVAADRADGKRCMGEVVQDCEAMLTDTERLRGRRNCGQCRRELERPTSPDGTPLCASEHRPCGRPLPLKDREKGQRNCGACRAHATRYPDQVRQHVEASRECAR